MRHEAIYSLYPNVVKIGDIAGAFDANGNKVEVDESLVQEKVEEFLTTQPLKELREERNQRLSETDWRDLPSYPGTDQNEWRTYRQALRDLPSTAEPQLDEQGNLTNVTWPTKPT